MKLSTLLTDFTIAILYLANVLVTGFVIVQLIKLAVLAELP